MDEKNEQALALAFKRARAKGTKIKELGIAVDFTEDQTDALITKLAKVKNPEAWEKEVAGQRWYVEDLIGFSGLGAQERLDAEYANAFPDVAEEDELVDALEALM